MCKKGKILLPVALMALIVAAFAYAVETWEPHGSGELPLTSAVLVAGIYALCAGIRRFRERNRAGLIACAVLLALCVAAGSIEFPYCPECDGPNYTVTPLMEKLLGDRLPNTDYLNFED